MDKYVPKRKLSKKQQSIENRKRRKTWGALSPVTRKPPNPKAYDRKKEKAVECVEDEEK